MMKKWFAALLAAWMLLSSVAWAEGEEYMVKEAYFCTANLFYCDAERNMVVLKNVRPLEKGNAQSEQIAQEAEYQELPISCEGKLLDGGYLPQSELNCYADCRVGVIMVRLNTGEIRVVALRFR